MCGFVIESVKNSKFKAVNNSILAHRGPDHYGILETENYIFRHWRLSIKDISNSSNQPFTYDNLTMVFNGEIYNHRLINRLLKSRGYSFETSGDTEIFIKGYHCFGSDFLKMIDGMFAVVIHDSHKDTVFLGRDKFGQKPLYYSLTDSRLIAASELKVFSNDYGFRSVNNNAFNDLFCLGHVVPPRTLLFNVKTLLPGEYILFSKDLNVCDSGNLNCGLFEQQKENVNNTSIFSLKDALIESVNSMLDTDVRTGIFLSGGLDSSIITCIAKKYLNRDVDCLTFVGDGTSDIDNLGSRSTAKHFGVNHIIVEDDGLDLLNKFDVFLNSIDHPSPDGFNSFLVSRGASDHGYKVMLSGIGADELFGGYPSFNYEKYYHNFGFDFPVMSRKSKLDKRITYFFEGDILKRYTKIRGLGSYSLDFSYLNEYFYKLGQVFGDNYYNNTLILESYSYMSQVLLRDMDQFSMANSIELRAPFLGNEILDLFNYLDFSGAFRAYGKKGVLKKIFENDFENDFFKKKKSGFEVRLDLLIQHKTGEMKKIEERLKNLGLGHVFDILTNSTGTNSIRKNALLIFLFQIDAFLKNHEINEVIN